jgi:hypothetical protein
MAPARGSPNYARFGKKPTVIGSADEGHKTCVVPDTSNC